MRVCKKCKSPPSLFSPSKALKDSMFSAEKKVDELRLADTELKTMLKTASKVALAMLPPLALCGCPAEWCYKSPVYSSIMYLMGTTLVLGALIQTGIDSRRAHALPGPLPATAFVSLLVILCDAYSQSSGALPSIGIVVAVGARTALLLLARCLYVRWLCEHGALAKEVRDAASHRPKSRKSRKPRAEKAAGPYKYGPLPSALKAAEGLATLQRAFEAMRGMPSLCPPGARGTAIWSRT